MAQKKYEEWITDEALIKIEGWAKAGLTDAQIAKNMGIVRTTLLGWKKKYEVINNALKKGKEVADFEVENALHKRATGYRYAEDTQELMPRVNEYGEQLYDLSGKPILELVTVKRVIKDVPPDVTAIIYWLKNRKPETWRNNPTELDRKEQESRIEKNKAHTDALRGIGEEIEDITQLNEIMGVDD